MRGIYYGYKTPIEASKFIATIKPKLLLSVLL